jgi:5-methylcytosine-specific restriction endonuclease McrA
MSVQLNGYACRVPNNTLLQDLLRVARAQGTNTLTYQQYKTTGQYYPSIYLRRFGTWNNALTLAGLQPTRITNIPAPHLLDNITQLWKKLGRQPALSDLVPPHSRYGRKPYIRTFGKWSEALRQAASRLTSPATGNTPPKTQKQNTTPRTIPWRLRHLVMKRDNFRCVQCGATPALHPGTTLHVDHITPYSKGGTNTLTNLQTLCQPCNIGKSNIKS